MNKNADFVQVSYRKLVQVLVDFSSVDSVSEVNLTSLSELLNHSEGLSADSALSLLGACTAVVSAIDTRMLG